MTVDLSPLFVFGVARSGTNLVTRILNGHARVAIALDPLLPMFKSLRNSNVECFGPRDLARNFDGQIPFQDYYFDRGDLHVLDILLAGSLDIEISTEVLRGVVAAIRNRAGLESESLSAGLANLSGSTYREIVDGVLEEVVRQSGKSPVRWAGSKELWTIEFVPLLARAYPTAKFIVIRRDPRAVVASLEVMSNKDPSQAAHTVSYMRHWRKEVAVVSTLLNDEALSDRIHLQSYESFVANPEGETSGLCEFLGVEYSHELLDPMNTDGTRWRGNSSYQDINGVSRDSVDRWRRHDFPGMVQTVEYHCAPEMTLSGYSLDYAPGGLLDDIVNDYVMRAHENPGSWRSDSGVPAEDLICEKHRWDLVSTTSGAGVPEDIRTSFLFDNCFRRISKAMN